MKDKLSEVVGFDVSRETFERLVKYDDLLKKWSPKINLVSASTLSDAWNRHIIDSAQLFRHIPNDTDQVLDFGSGAGFPGLVCAVLADQCLPGLKFSLIESDQRKCTFLRTVARETGIKVDVSAKRIESMPKQNCDVITARAVMDLSNLLEVMNQHANPGATGLFPKGARWQAEITAAQEKWRFRYEAHPSITNENAVILEIHELSHA